MSFVYFIKPIGMPRPRSPIGWAFLGLKGALRAPKHLDLRSVVAEFRNEGSHWLGANKALMANAAAFAHRQIRPALQCRNALLHRVKTVWRQFYALPPFPSIQGFEQVIEERHG